MLFVLAWGLICFGVFKIFGSGRASHLHRHNDRCFGGHHDTSVAQVARKAMKVTVQSVVSFTPPQRSIALSLYFMVG